MSDETTLLPCPLCGGKITEPLSKRWTNCLGDESWSASVACPACNLRIETRTVSYETERDAIEAVIAKWNARTHGTLTAELVEKIVDRNCEWYEGGEIDAQAILDELNAELGSGKAKDLLLRMFGLAQMMYDCWLEECKAGDNVDVSACNAYSYEFDQIAQAMFDMGIDPNDSDYYRSAELGSGTCELVETDSYSNADEVVHVLECSACGETCEHVNGTYPRCPHCGAKAVER